MSRWVWLLIAAAILTSGFGVWLLGGALHWTLTAQEPAARLAYLQLYHDVLKTIGTGFLVAMLGLLVPIAIGEARYRFEMRKASRQAYSEAKTGLVYFKARAATLTHAEAVKLLQHVHYQKHYAELFDDIGRHARRRHGWWIWAPENARKSNGKKRLGWLVNATYWDEKVMYPGLFGARDVLETEAANWDYMKPDERVAALELVMPTKPEIKGIERYSVLKQQEAGDGKGDTA